MAAQDVAAFYREAIEKRTDFSGQSSREFQARLAEAHAGVTPQQCDFYHTMDFGGGEVYPGPWDLRGGERNYLGYLDLSGRRVLEIGPATGYFSTYLEQQGAEVVCFDLAPGMAQDIVPQLGHDLEAQGRLSVAYAERVRNSWWYGHARLKSKNQAVYGDIYWLPSDVGRFDVSTLGSTLLHLSKPFFALQQAASVTDKAIVVTEPIAKVAVDHESAWMEFVPVDTSKTVVVWWLLTPGAIVRMLKVLGFFEASVYYHVQKHHSFHDLGKPPDEYLFVTVVGMRYPDMVPALPRTEAELQVEREVKRRFAPETSKVAELEAEVRSLEAETLSLRSSLSWRASKPIRVVGSLLRRLGLR